MIEIILPAILTVILNILFYLFIKKRIDRSIEEYKIAYSGIFKEKIEVYREILDKSYRIMTLVSRYHISSNEDQKDEFLKEIETFINYYLKNQPFLSENMLDKLKKIRAEFQFVFDNSYMYFSILDNRGIPKEMRTEITSKFFEAGNKLKKNNSFDELIKVVVKEMREDLKTDKVKKDL